MLDGLTFVVDVLIGIVLLAIVGCVLPRRWVTHRDWAMIVAVVGTFVVIMLTNLLRYVRMEP